LLTAGTTCLLGVLMTLPAPHFSDAQAPKSVEVTVVNGGAGPCSADFVVTDASKKGIYDAKIRIQIKYGFWGMRRLEMEAGTNSDGKARFEGLPQKIGKPVEFQVRHGNQTKSVLFNPESNCHSRHEIVLGENPAAP
jgi:hypothetical protein